MQIKCLAAAIALVAFTSLAIPSPSWAWQVSTTRWSGSWSDELIWSGAAWSSSLPSSTRDAVIHHYVDLSNYSAQARNLSVENGGVLLVNNADLTTYANDGGVNGSISLNNSAWVYQYSGTVTVGSGSVAGGGPALSMNNQSGYAMYGGTLRGVTSGGSRRTKIFIGNEQGVSSFVQSGGQIHTIDDLHVGNRDGGSQHGSGNYYMSGGSLELSSQNSDFVLGSNTSPNHTGLFEIRGSAPTNIFVNRDFRVQDTGTLRMLLDANGVTPITIGAGSAADILLSSSSQLELGLLTAPPLENIMLIEDTGDGSVQGNFFGMPEGALISLAWGETTYQWDLTYVGGSGNDIELINPRAFVVPEPSTIALAAGGILLVVFRKRFGRQQRRSL